MLFSHALVQNPRTCSFLIVLFLCLDDTDMERRVMFQLGALILELIGSDLIDWIQQYNTGSSMHKLLDRDLGNDYDSKELKDLLYVARLCINSRDKPVLSSTSRLLRYLQKKTNAPVD